MLDRNRTTGILSVYMEKEASRASKAMKQFAAARAAKAARKASRAARVERNLSSLSNVAVPARGASAREVSRTLGQSARAEDLGLSMVADKLNNKATKQVINRNRRVAANNKVRYRQVLKILRAQREGLITRGQARQQAGAVLSNARPNRSNRAAFQLNVATPGAVLPYSGTTGLRTSNIIGADGKIVRKADPGVVARAGRNTPKNPNNPPSSKPINLPAAPAGAAAAGRSMKPWLAAAGVGAGLGLGALARRSSALAAKKSLRNRRIALGAGFLGAGALGAGMYQR